MYAQQHAEFTIRKAQKSSNIALLIAANPHLIPGCDCVTAAKNIRKELKVAFPKTKFSVTTDRFAGGNAIRVHWTDGPTDKQVSAITCRYKAGHFDGMTDCYNYDDNVWGDAFGDSKYITTSRHFSDEVIDAVINDVCNYLGGVDAIPTAEDWNKGSVWNTYTSGGCDLHRAIGNALSEKEI